MSLRELLSQKRSPILKRWLDLIAASQPAGKPPVKTNKDPFSNPEGYTLNLETEAIFSELVQDRMDTAKVCSSLENIIKIKAVQDITPGQALSFMFLCKEAIIEELMDEIEKRNYLGQWLELESRIDKLATLSFDIYTQCREKICQLRIKEIKAQKEIAYRIVELMNRAEEKPFEVME